MSRHVTARLLVIHVHARTRGDLASNAARRRDGFPRRMPIIFRRMLSIELVEREVTCYLNTNHKQRAMPSGQKRRSGVPFIRMNVVATGGVVVGNR